MCAPGMADMTRGKRPYSVRFYSPSKEDKGKKKIMCLSPSNKCRTDIKGNFKNRHWGEQLIPCSRRWVF